MNLHEYQAKSLFAEYGLPVSEGFACDTAQEAVEAAGHIGGNMWVVKCQVHAGGRGKAGGVKVTGNKDEIRAFAENWLGKNLVTYQTDAKGQPVAKILVESCTDIANELYLGAVVDRSTRRVVFMASTEGGVEIEKVAEESPELIHTAIIDPLTGPQAYQARDLGFKLGLNPTQMKQFTKIFMGLANMFNDHDFALLEINPLVITTEGNLHCLDGKIGIDGNALFRQPKIKAMHDPSQDDAREAHAAKLELNYVALDGNVGCMVNGAGLAMATMDIIKLAGGEPANFLDVGGTANAETVKAGFNIILSDPNVKAILINIFGGIVRCDRVAQGVIDAYKEIGNIPVPIIVRLQGTNAVEAKKLIDESGLEVFSAIQLKEAADLVTKVLKG